MQEERESPLPTAGLPRVSKPTLTSLVMPSPGCGERIGRVAARAAVASLLGSGMVGSLRWGGVGVEGIGGRSPAPVTVLTSRLKVRVSLGKRASQAEKPARRSAAA